MLLVSILSPVVMRMPLFFSAFCVGANHSCTYCRVFVSISMSVFLTLLKNYDERRTVVLFKLDNK